MSSSLGAASATKGSYGSVATSAGAATAVDVAASRGATLEDDGYVAPETQSWLQWVTLSKGYPLTYRFTDNLKAGATVALVNIPLGIALSLAGGGTPAQGIITTFWGGLIAGIFGASHYNIVGTTGALSGILSAAALTYGSEGLVGIAICTAILLFVFAIIRMDKVLAFVNTPVAEGFSVAVAVIIAMSQVPSAFGLSGLTPCKDFAEKVAMSFSHMNTMRVNDTATFVIGFALLYKLSMWKGTIPWAVVLASAGIAMGAFLPPGTLVLLSAKYPNIPATVVATVNQVKVRAMLGDPNVWHIAYTVAMVALLETLISAAIGNNVAKESIALNTWRESFGVALANAVSGLVGGIPCTAALARTSLNVRSGAYSRVSVILGALMVGGVSLFVLPLFEHVPMAIIAAILMMVSYRLIRFHELHIIRDTDIGGTYLFIITTLSCLFIDTFYGLVIGAVISVLMNRKTYRKTFVDLRADSTSSSAGTNAYTVTIHSDVTFLNTEAHIDVVKRFVKESTESLVPGTVRLVLSDSIEIDVDGYFAIGKMVTLLWKADWTVVMTCTGKQKDSLSHQPEVFGVWAADGTLRRPLSQ